MSASSAAAQERPSRAEAEAAVRQVLDEQVAAWNRGDIEGFMEGYWQSDSLRFASGGTVRYGWQETLEGYQRGYPDRAAMGTLTFSDLDVAMTAVEGYAELLMDRAFDDEYADLRRKLDERRRGGGPFVQLMRRLLGLGRKRRQYERGKDFFDGVADARDVETAALVWERPENLPTDAELDDPAAWLQRMGV